MSKKKPSSVEQKFVVKNPRKHPGSVYVGRPTKWGNPFVIGKDGSRSEVIKKYEAWIHERGMEAEIRETLRGKVLACWCHPLPCHADILARIANSPSQQTILSCLRQPTKKN